MAPRAFRLLEVLAERRPRAVSRSELRETLWPDTPAGGTTLARLMCEVRAALDDRAAGAPLHPNTAPLRVRVSRGGRRGYSARTLGALQLRRSVRSPRFVTLAPGENLIGRAATRTRQPSRSTVSRRHARIVVERGPCGAGGPGQQARRAPRGPAGSKGPVGSSTAT